MNNISYCFLSGHIHMLSDAQTACMATVVALSMEKKWNCHWTKEC